MFDLDGTLLQSDKTISGRTLSILEKCMENNILVGVSTSRSEQIPLLHSGTIMQTSECCNYVEQVSLWGMRLMR